MKMHASTLLYTINIDQIFLFIVNFPINNFLSRSSNVAHSNSPPPLILIIFSILTYTITDNNTGSNRRNHRRITMRNNVHIIVKSILCMLFCTLSIT